MSAGQRGFLVGGTGMRFGTEGRNRFGGSDHRYLPANPLPQRILGAVTLAFVATLCGWTVCVFANTGADETDIAIIRDDKGGAAVTFADRFARANSLND